MEIRCIDCDKVLAVVSVGKEISLGYVDLSLECSCGEITQYTKRVKEEKING